MEQQQDPGEELHELLVGLEEGLPSWEGDNPEVYRIHCISKKGTVWEFQRIEDPEG